VTRWSASNQPALIVLISRAPLDIHNAARRTGESLEFESDPPQWGYSVSFPIDIPVEPDARLQPLVVLAVRVDDGAIGVGILDGDWSGFVTPEHSLVAPQSARIELRLASGGVRVHLMLRNVFERGPSRFTVLGVTLQFIARDGALLTRKPIPPIESVARDIPRALGVFDILVSHTSRHWVREQCDREYLRQRWAKPGRLDFLDPFDTLPRHAAPYFGLLSVFRIELSRRGASGRMLHHYVSSQKVVHAAVMGTKIIVAFDDSVAIFDRPGDRIDLDPDSGRCLADPWFGGLHTAIPVDDTTCLLSSSAADAVLWLDTFSGSVVRRWRLPSDRYGSNYRLDATTRLSEHYIPNDFQLGHLNCAAPDGQGGAFVSVLGQGDIAHVSASGGFELMATGFVGCHSIRFAAQQDLLYFCDSCSGRLMRVEGPQRVAPLFETGSLWLHDAVHLTADLFVMTVADRNGLVLADVKRGNALAEWDFSAAVGTVQFLSVASRTA
jgi:hypothetical protein